ncbi:MAG: DUF805 domain-containing protein [Caldilineaceae bacterium]|jgi:uncharacterized membrane protein YhaH (DUF805 family)
MEFWQWVLFSFNGRISRKYYWYVFLAFIVVEAIYMAVLFGSNAQAFASGDMSAMSPIAFLCAVPLFIAAIWIGLAVSVKRWHDRSKSGWWILIGLIPIIGSIWVLVECGFLPGADGVNQYGVANQLPTNPYTQTGPPPPLPAAPPDVQPNDDQGPTAA